jgi:MoaD family protein
MKVHLKILVPMLSQAIGEKELEVEFAGDTVNDLIEHLVARYGQKTRQALFNEKGELASIVQVLLNGKEWVPHHQLDTTLQDGDSVVLMIIMAGG